MTATDKQGVCVLGFVAEDEGIRRLNFGSVVGEGEEEAREFLVFGVQRLLERLRGLQGGLDLVGVLGVGER